MQSLQARLTCHYLLILSLLNWILKEFLLFEIISVIY